MNQLKLYGRWLKARLDTINTQENKSWGIVYVLFTLAWWSGAHLLYLKKYKKLTLYLLGWVIIIGAWLAAQYTTIIPLLSILGILLLLIGLIIDFFFVYRRQRREMRTHLAPFVVLFLFAAQILLYEYLFNGYQAQIREGIMSYLDHFQKSAPRY